MPKQLLPSFVLDVAGSSSSLSDSVSLPLPLTRQLVQTGCFLHLARSFLCMTVLKIFSQIEVVALL